MGFGTLFIGYFLLLNITHSGLTDILASLVMLMALNKLSWINKEFKNTLFVNFSFVFVSFISFILELLKFLQIEFSIVEGVLGAIRAVILFVFTVLLLKGILSLSREVCAKDISVRARRNLILAPVCYIPFIILELPILSLLPSAITPVLSVIGIVTTLLHVILLILNLALIYTCYMRICMPEERFETTLDTKKDKPIGFFEKSKKERKEALLETKNKEQNNEPAKRR